jgi:hypothetical protein
MVSILIAAAIIVLNLLLYHWMKQQHKELYPFSGWTFIDFIKSRNVVGSGMIGGLITPDRQWFTLEADIIDDMRRIDESL